MTETDSVGSDEMLQSRLARIEAAIERQRRYIVTVPDADNREQAEHNLITLVEMREGLQAAAS